MLLIKHKHLRLSVCTYPKPDEVRPEAAATRLPESACHKPFDTQHQDKGIYLFPAQTHTYHSGTALCFLTFPMAVTANLLATAGHNKE